MGEQVRRFVRMALIAAVFYGIITIVLRSSLGIVEVAIICGVLTVALNRALWRR